MTNITALLNEVIPGEFDKNQAEMLFITRKNLRNLFLL